MKKGIVSQIILSKRLNIGQIYTIPKLIKKEIEKKKKKKYDERWSAIGLKGISGFFYALMFFFNII